MIFEQYTGYNKPQIKKINSHVYIGVYKGKNKPTFIVIANNKVFQQAISLLPETIKKICKKI